MKTLEACPAFTARSLAKLLENVNPLSLWGGMIRDIVKKPTQENMNELVITLRSQAEDNPAKMREILGGIIYDKIIPA